MTPTQITPRLDLDPAVAELDTVADLLERLGGIPASRVRWQPYPGTATEQDLIAIVDGPNKRLCELVDGTLIEKAAGIYESRVGGVLAYFMEGWSERNDRGLVFGANAMCRILPGRVRMPDVSFVWWDKLPNDIRTAEPIANWIPDLAVEVLSEGNSRREMEIKRSELFQGGARLIWEITSIPQAARMYTDIKSFEEIGPDGALDGRDVLPGFILPLRQLFDRAGRRRGKDSN
jgi:Uma2 family endonuclease